MNNKAFLNKVFRTGGEVPPEEIAKFMLKNYFLYGETLTHFEDDLYLVHNKSEEYAVALRDLFEEKLIEYSK